VLKIAFIDNILILRHYLMDYFIIKLGIFIEHMLIHNTISFIYTAYTFHVILYNTRLANLLLVNEWLNNNVKLAPKVKNVRHQLVNTVVYLHGAIICSF
jgi:hypothetical protein